MDSDDYGVVFVNNNEEKINVSYCLLNTENSEKQCIKICQGKPLTFLIHIDQI